uniref:Uncharacterized protein n=1 Tax=Octopus bimaculoides TaxID=37653 RepID=A0A0L8FQ38_OCTBM
MLFKVTWSASSAVCGSEIHQTEHILNKEFKELGPKSKYFTYVANALGKSMNDSTSIPSHFHLYNSKNCNC